MKLKITGVIVPLLTPFTAQGKVDNTALTQLVDFLTVHGVNGLFPAGTTGEGPLLTLPERRTVAETVVKASAGRVPVIIHTGSITTAETIELTQHARHIGATAAAIVPPYYFHYSDEALFQHYSAVAAATPEFPLYLYNNPGVGNHNALSPALITRLLDRHSNIVGMKDSSGSMELLTRMARHRQDHFNTASGGDGQILMGVAAGIDACVSGNANVVPELVVALHRAASAGDWALARKLQQQMDDVRRILEDGRDLSLFKAMLARRGLNVGTVRAPLLPASDTVVEQRWQALTEMGLEFSPV